MSIRYQCDRCDADLEEAGTCELSFSASKPHVITPLTATMHLCVKCGDAMAKGLQLLLQKAPKQRQPPSFRRSPAQQMG
jgi:hypothetical protein